jgi:hypothetical protein
MRESCFSWALRQARIGNHIFREGWNGKNLHVEVQTPDESSKMTERYLVLVKTTPGEKETRIPWVPSQGDLFALDWDSK